MANSRDSNKPVAWMRHPSAVNQGWDEIGFERAFDDDTPLFTAPRQWQGLTADEIWACNVAPVGHDVTYHISMANQNVLDFAEAIEAKLRQKNA